jgi:hypothetical protein
VTDSGGLSATGSFTVTVNLTVAPNNPPAFMPPPNMTIVTTNPTGEAVTFVAAGNDAEDGPIAAACIPQSGAIFPLGTTTVSCTVTDSGGLSVSGGFTVTVTTNNKPPMIEPPRRMNVLATSAAGAVVTYTASASDREDGPLPVTCLPSSGTTFPIGTTTVSCSATDSGGLTATAATTVTVYPNTAPKVMALAKIIKPASGPNGAIVEYPASATDAEDGVLPVTCTVPSGSLFPIGSTNVYCSATDSHGATTTVMFRVTITAP